MGIVKGGLWDSIATKSSYGLFWRDIRDGNGIVNRQKRLKGKS